MLRLQLFGTACLARDGRVIAAAAGYPRRLALLAILAAHADAGRGVSRDAILSLLWPDSTVARARNSLKQLLFEIRRMCEADAVVMRDGRLFLDASVIESDTLTRSTGAEFLPGPFLSATPEFIAWVNERRAAFAGAPAAADRHPGPVAVSASPQRSRWSARPVTASAFVLGAAVILALTAGESSPDSHPAVAPEVDAVSAASARARAKVSSIRGSSIVVAPFDNLTGDSAFDALGALATYSITASLSALDSVAVMASVPDLSTVVNRKPNLDAARRHAREFRASWVVWGVMDLLGDSVRLNAQLVDARDGHIEIALEPIAAHRREAVRAVTLLQEHLFTALDAKSLGPRLGSLGRPPSLNAYREFLLGLHEHWEGAGAPGSLPHFERAATLDPSFTLASAYVINARRNFGTGAARADRIAHYAAADSVARILERRRPSMPPVERELADAAIATARSDLEQVLLALRAVFARDSSARTLNNLMLAARQTNRPREALTALRAWGGEERVATTWSGIAHYQLISLHRVGAFKEERAAAERWWQRGLRDEPVMHARLRGLIGLHRTAELRVLVDSVLSLWDGSGTPVIFETVAQELFAHGDSAEAHHFVSRGLGVLSSRPASERSRPARVRMTARLLWLRGALDSAVTLLQGLAQTDSTYEGARLDLTLVSAVLGDTALAGTALKYLEYAADRYDYGRARHAAARILAAAGRKEEAVRMLRTGIGEGLPYDWARFPFWHADPAFALMRSYPPFAAMLKPRG